MLQVVSILFVVAVFVTAIIRPAVAVAVLVSMFPLEQLLQANAPFFAANASAFNIICGLLAVVATLTKWLRRPDTLIGSLNSTALSCFALFSFAAMSLVWTRNPEWASATVMNGLPYAIVLLIFTPLLVNDIEELKVLSKSMLVISLLIALQLIANPNLELYSARLVLEIDASEKSNPLVLGTMGGGMVILAALLHFEKSWWWSIIRYASAFSGLGLAVLSGSRGQVIFAVLAAALFFPMSRHIPDLRRLAGTTFAFAVLVLVSYLGIRNFISLDNEGRWSSESLVYGGLGRLDNAVDLLVAWIREPAYLLVGLGYFAFGALQSRSGDGYSHVMIADSLGELGLIGFSLYLSFWILVSRTILRLFRAYRDDPEYRSVLAAMAAMMVFTFFLQNKQGTLWGIDASWILGLMLARIDVRDRLLGTSPEFVHEGTEDVADDLMDEPAPPPGVAA